MAESELLGGVRPHVAPFITLEDAGKLIAKAGFTLPVIDKETYILEFNSLKELIDELRYFGMTAPLLSSREFFLGKKMFQKIEDFYFSKFATREQKLKLTVDILWGVAWSPHFSQQKPLKPGVGQVSLQHYFENKNKN